MDIQEKYETILNFVKTIIEEHDDDFIFDRESEICFKNTNESLYKSEFQCVYINLRAIETLKKIGEYHD